MHKIINSFPGLLFAYRRLLRSRVNRLLFLLYPDSYREGNSYGVKVVFYNFIDVPYLYLFYTSSFISLMVLTVVICRVETPDTP